MAQQMTPEEYRSFLTAGTRTAKVATVGADGRPHVVPIWFVLDGDTVVFTTGDRSAKALHMRRDPRVALVGSARGYGLGRPTELRSPAVRPRPATSRPRSPPMA